MKSGFIVHILAFICITVAVTACRAERPDPLISAIEAALADQEENALTGVCTATAGATIEIEVRATSRSAWTYCDLAISGTTTADGPWDLAFQRFQIATNSGTSGSGSGGACNTGLTDINAVTGVSQFSGSTDGQCPNFQVDSLQNATIGDTGGSSTSSFNANPVMVEWYNYNSSTHVLTSKNEVYVVRSSDGSTHYAVQMTDYYSDAGTSGYPSFRFKQIAAP